MTFNLEMSDFPMCHSLSMKKKWQRQHRDGTIGMVWSKSEKQPVTAHLQLWHLESGHVQVLYRYPKSGHVQVLNRIRFCHLKSCHLPRFVPYKFCTTLTPISALEIYMKAIYWKSTTNFRNRFFFRLWFWSSADFECDFVFNNRKTDEAPMPTTV